MKNKFAHSKINPYLCSRKTAEHTGQPGVMLEWLKRHAWKACIRQKRIPSSNLGHSANQLNNQAISN